jgi:large subunit ribosomal protein L13
MEIGFFFLFLRSQKIKVVNTLSYKTISANKATVVKKWYIVDAEDQVLGRFASQVAMIARGKNKPDFTPHVDCGDHIIVINADKIRLTGKKMNDKEYVSYSGYPGGQKWITAKRLMAKNPTAVVEKAVKGMLPKNRLAARLLKNVHIIAGSEHTHQAQQPQKITFNI